LPAEYKLQKGEFPYCIARRYNVNQSQLLKINGLSYGMLFKPGLVMKLPQTGDPWVGTRALRTHPAQYTVRSGDTFASIACYYGDVDPAAIATLNGLDPAQPLQAGQVLQIP
jgi:LysM repeat protein